MSLSLFGLANICSWLPLFAVTRSKTVDLQKKQTSRSVFQCYVFGPPGVGKVR